MGRPHILRLRESDAPAPKSAKIIDAQFEVVGRRTPWSRVRLALIAALWAALIGFAVPQIWIFSQRIGEFMAER